MPRGMHPREGKQALVGKEVASAGIVQHGPANMLHATCKTYSMEGFPHALCRLPSLRSH